VPLGSKIEEAFVHEVDAGRKRIGLTTYPPEQWDDMLPLKEEVRYIRNVTLTILDATILFILRTPFGPLDNSA
jgi:hypothetical protein